jgi:glycosyl transferase family 87
VSTGRRRSLALALALSALAVLPGPAAARPLSNREALRAALADSKLRQVVEGEGYTRYRVSTVDDELTRISFFDGPRVVLEAAMDERGQVVTRSNYLARSRYGTELANSPLVLALLTGLFLLATLSVPLRSMRNLDALALAGFVVPIALLNERFLSLSVLSGYALLLYLGVRCLRHALLAPKPHAPAIPLLIQLTEGWDESRRTRTIGFVTGVAALVVGLITLTSTNVIDVGFASINGATLLTDGTLPYGHVTNEIVHGDTYPLLCYALYMPAAALLPVRDVFDSMDGALIMAAIAALAGAVAMARVESGGRRLTAAIAWLSFPPVLITASSGSNDIVLAALVAWALVLWLHAGRSTLAWSLAAWVKVVPLAVLPLWLGRFRSARELARAWGALAAVTLGSLAWLLALDGTRAIEEMLRAISYQSERRSLYSAWTLLEVEPVKVVFLLGLVVLMVLAAVRVRRHGADVSRLAALAGALLILSQLAGNYWAPVYLSWTFPCVYLALLSGSAAASRSAAD